MHLHQPISVAARCAAILLSASPPPYTGPGTPLNDATFQAALEQDDFDGLTVAKFFARGADVPRDLCTVCEDCGAGE